MELKEGDIVFFNYRDNRTEAEVVKITKTRVQLKFKTKTTGEFRTIWKNRADNWQIEDIDLVKVVKESLIEQFQSLLKQKDLSLSDKIAIEKQIEELQNHE